jgi:phosphate transport system protein
MVALRVAFDRQLNMLESDVLRLGEMVETQLTETIKALQSRDAESARRIAEFDTTINRLRYDVEEQSYLLLALQQPTAGDMRRIVAAVSIATNLERMGDHAASIARAVQAMGDRPFPIDLDTFLQMAGMAACNLSDAMMAMDKQDASLARAVVRRDEQIDALHKRTYQLLIEAMIADPAAVECATRLLEVSHDLERYADRVSNICERVVYMVTGALCEPRIDPMP